MTDEGNISAIPAEEDAEYGFKRQEMYSSSLAGTVDPYGRHVFLCYKSPETWAERVENDDLPKRLADALKARKDDIPVKTKLTVVEGGDSDGDVLVFPEMLRYKGLKSSDVDAFVEDVLANGKPWASGVQEVLDGSFVFVCAHASRDKRCGVCGPAFIAKFKQEIESRGLSNKVHVEACSHLGGHKYAGNLVIYSPGPDGEIMGHWYGYATPNDVPEMLDQHIGKGIVIERLWRGQMGLVSKESGREDVRNVPNGSTENQSDKQESKEGKEAAGGCCQGANDGASCCMNSSSDSGERKGLCGIPSSIRELDQKQILTAAAVLGAVAAVAVGAYRVYRNNSD